MVNFENVKKILNNELSFTFKSIETTKTIKIDELPEASIAVILDYGTRKLNDAVNSAFANPKNAKSREVIIEEIWKKLLNGTLGIRQSVDTELRDFIIENLSSNLNFKDILKDAKKKSPRDILSAIFPDATSTEIDNKLNKAQKLLEEQKRLRASFTF